ncbi:MAG: hypothetical protein AAF829_02850 [Pseudomonadota bacterium]
MGSWSARIAVLVLSLGAAACTENVVTRDTVIEICRPANVEPALLGIGSLPVPRDQLVARVQHTSITEEYGVSIRLSEQYSEAVAQLTREKLGQPLAISLDETVIAEPLVVTPILDGRILITGNYTRSAASDIVAQLSGPCPPDNRS